jgi:NAD(P)-dependent dehydrogenase (short-subunit alcohol dehydrogenase family)
MTMSETLPAGLGRLNGKVAIVTGAASGIGRATALRFAAEGARLVVNDIDAPRLETLRASIAAAGGEVRAAVGDVAKTEDAEAMVAAAVAAFGRLDVLVANAGIIPEMDLATATAEDFDHVMAIDGRGMFLSCKFAVAAMLKTGGGAIVCLSSISGEAGQKRQAVYGPAKFVASGITKHLAVELAAQGIRVNAVAPPTIATEGLKKMSDDYIAGVTAAHPIGRVGQPAEVAAAILFLASDDASFITGAVLPVDGGYLAQ